MALDVHEALVRDVGLAERASQPGAAEVLERAIRAETVVRTDPEARADRFVATWTGLLDRLDQLEGWEHWKERDRLETRLETMARGLEQDPKLETALGRRREELGLELEMQGPSMALHKSMLFGLGKGRDHDRSI